MAISGRLYRVTFKTSVSNVQDLIGIYAGANKIVAVHGLTLESTGSTSVQNLPVSFVRLPATVTGGSGGSAGSVKPVNPVDASATVTARLNDTTQATTSGTADVIDRRGWNTLNGLFFLPPIPGRPVIIDRNEAFILSLDTGPSSALLVSGKIELEEFL